MSRPLVSFLARSLTAVLLLAAPTAAQGVQWTVSPDDPNADFDELQPAIDAASDGDTIYLLPGLYLDGVIDGKSLRIVSAGDPVPSHESLDAVNVRGLDVRNLTADQELYLRGIWIWETGGDASMTFPVVDVKDCAGTVTIEECFLRGNLSGRGDAIVVFDSTGVVTVTRCELLGGRSSAAINVNGGEVHVFESTLVGGRGLHTGCAPQKGGKGVNVTSSTVFVSDSTIRGGTGGTVTCTTAPGGDGGDGLVVQGESSFVGLLATSVQGGFAGSEPGGFGAFGTPQVVNGGVVVPLAGKPRSVEASRLVFEEDVLTVSLRGETADLAFLLFSPFSEPVLLIDCLGPIVPTTPLFTKLLGFVPESGELELNVPITNLSPDPEAIPLWFQGAFFPPDLSCHLSSASLTVLRSCGLSGGDLDCNGNGFDDECDIRRGVETDVNLTGVPDSCEVFATLVVDDDAPDDPGPGDSSVSDPLEDGSFAHPFDSLADAIAASQLGDTILVRDGVYDGAANREIDVLRNVIIKSENGSASTFLDLEGAGRGLKFFTAITEFTRVEGFTVLNGADPAFLADVSFAYYGEGVRIDDCVFEGFTDKVIDGKFRVSNSRFVANHEVGRGSAFLDCEFIDNEVSGWYYNDIELRDCTFLRSGFDATYAEDVVVDRCDFRFGAGLFLNLPDSFSVRNSSFVQQDNYAIAILQAGPGEVVGTTVFGAGAMSSPVAGMHLSAGSGLEVVVENCIVWGTNGSPSLNLGVSDATVRYSDIEGGEAEVVSYATFTWEPNNLDTDPLFVGPTDAHLTPGSPCIDAGDPLFVPLEGETDLDGNPRVEGAAVDMGAYEQTP